MDFGAPIFQEKLSWSWWLWCFAIFMAGSFSLAIWAALGISGALIVSADRDLHVANAAVPTGFFKVFSATISNTLASLGTGYNNYKFVHSTSGNTN